MEKKQFIPFGGVLNQESDINEAQVIVLPICYENAPSYGTGSIKGPIHILEASEQLEDLDEETLINWTKTGIHTLQPFYPSKEPEQAIMQMKSEVARIFRYGKFLLCLGGDHAISIGPVMALSEFYKDLGVLQIDAHLDLRDRWNGSDFNHACVMRRIVDDVKLPIVQVGIRSFSQEEADFVKNKNLKPFYAHNISESDDLWIDQVVERLPEYVYITIDLDGLDPCFIPGTGTPEPGGLSYRQVVKLIRSVGQKRKIVASDINELTKIKGTQVSEYTAAKIATKLFVYCLIR